MRSTPRPSMPATWSVTARPTTCSPSRATNPPWRPPSATCPRRRFPPVHQTVDRGHGRIEHRRVHTAPVPAGTWFPHAKQVLVIQRHTTDLSGGHPRTEVRTGHGLEVMATLRNLAISLLRLGGYDNIARGVRWTGRDRTGTLAFALLGIRSEEHTSELQSHHDIVC